MSNRMDDHQEDVLHGHGATAVDFEVGPNKLDLKVSGVFSEGLPDPQRAMCLLNAAKTVIEQCIETVLELVPAGKRIEVLKELDIEDEAEKRAAIDSIRVAAEKQRRQNG